MTNPLWRPGQDRIRDANITRFAGRLEAFTGEKLPDYRALYDFSLQSPDVFWSEVWDFTGVIGAKGNDYFTAAEHIRDSRWFPQAKLNFAENLLHYRDSGLAIIARLENGRRRQITYQELYEEVAKVVQGLRSRGIVKDDRVVGFMPNVIETVVCMLATASIGAIWSSCSPDFGIAGVLDRFGQIEPKVMFACDGYFYNGRVIDTTDRVRTVARQITSIEQVVMIPVASESPTLPDGWLSFSEFAGDSQDAQIHFEACHFDHPLYIMYSSGTTGMPKCIVHGAGGTLLQHLKEHSLHVDLKRDDRFFYFTTCSWMMWNWLVSGLASGATLILYDGSPFHPGAITLWDMIDEEQISIFGVSARYLVAVEKEGLKPAASHRLANLRTILSTGSPLSHESFRFVYRDIKRDVCLSSISGGTDIISCFVLGNPTLPVYEGELQCLGLGMRVEIWKENGESVSEEKGELVCTASFPSMPVGFWNDDSGAKYHDAYFSKFENVWAHGDFGELTANGGMIIHGRSDAVLNPGGVRIGTAEIYRQVEQFDQVVDSICIGQNWQGDIRIVLFVVIREGLNLTDELRDEIRRSIRRDTSPRHVPAIILQVADIPRTVSGKIVELAVRDVIHGVAVKNLDALANPEALEQFRDLAELKA